MQGSNVCKKILPSMRRKVGTKGMTERPFMLRNLNRFEKVYIK